MEGVIEADALLDYAEFEVFPAQNRYEASVRIGKKVETVTSGILEQLLSHSAKVKDLCSKSAYFKIYPPGNLNGAGWFTKSTITRFLRIVGSQDIVDITNAIENEISQLEETRRFQLSLSVKAEVDIVSSDASKNELLRAMDLRLIALRGEMVAAFNQAAGASCSTKEITDLEKVSHHFGAVNIRNSLRKLLELNKESQVVDFPSVTTSSLTEDSRNGRASKTEGSTRISKPSQLDTRVNYGVSPAKVAQVERETSTESEESSFSSEEDRPSVERSRPPIRSASPRRSASPMRRVQIGRSGSRRATAVTIKSLSYPARERVMPHKDAAANSSEEEGSEQPIKSNNKVRISVQDAISLFESKQRDQPKDIQKTKSLLNASIGAKKSVLRRWSSGMGESSAQSLQDVVSESSNPTTPNNLAGGEIPENSQAVELISDLNSGCHLPAEVDSSEKRSCSPIHMQVDTLVSQKEETNEKSSASAEWSRQKEAELNQLLTKMMENKPTKYQNMMPDNNKNKNVPVEQKGGFYDHYKQKRDEKLRGDIAGKQAEKEAQFRAMQQFLDERKAEMASTNPRDAGRRHTVSNPQKTQKKTPQLANPKKETSKPAVAKKASPKPSSLPATRKSWPSTPLPRVNGTSPAKTPAGTTPTRQKPQPASSAPRPTPKVERSQPRPKSVKATQNETKSVQSVNEKKQQTEAKNGKIAKPKVQTTSVDRSSMGKPSFYSKVTKKSSVVPLESKPFLRKGSGTGPGVGPVAVKTKVASQPEESVRNCEVLVLAEESNVITDTSDLVIRQHDSDLEASHVNSKPENPVISPQKGEETEIITQVTASDNEKMVAEFAIKSGAEEEIIAKEEIIISPTAWVEIEEYQDESIPCENTACQSASPVNVAPVGISSPRVRHSLSQMLLEESTEPDISEWGNAENPPAMIYQKGAPKGLKRLLKFARKTKADTHLTGRSSPSAFSEGEDDAEESKASKRDADSLRRKAALHTKNYGQQKNTSSEAYVENLAQSNISKFNGRNSHELQKGHTSASVTTTKATRSFFSLSAFKGSKPNEARLH